MNDKSAIKAILEIRRNADGLIRKEKELQDYYGDFIWMEGNFACDCNRFLFWCWAGEEPEPDEDAPEHQCSDDRFSVRLTDLSGKVLYCDFPGEYVDDQSRAA